MMAKYTAEFTFNKTTYRISRDSVEEILDAMKENELANDTSTIGRLISLGAHSVAYFDKSDWASKREAKGGRVREVSEL